jgi:REP element-mobilizing transposase RayT
MARPLRLEFAGALYHVTARGDRREDIYEDDEDRRMYLAILSQVVDRFNWLLHAYCLMSNHYHLLIETPDGNLAQGMRQLNGVFTQQSNRRHGRTGHLFQGRYKAILVQKNSYLLEVARYVVLNPVRARMVGTAGDWAWSSYRATAGESARPVWLTTDWLLSAFGANRRQAERSYQAFVAQGVGQPPPWTELQNQILLGDAEFIDQMQNRIDQLEQPLQEVPRAQRVGRARPIAEYERTANSRNQAIALAYASGGYSMKEIGEHFGLHYSRVSRIIQAAEAKGKT